MIQKRVLISQIIWVIFMKILKNTIQKKCEIFVVFDYMFADMLNNQKFNLMATELFI